MRNKAIALLIEARRLHNQTVRDFDEVSQWHQQVDALLAETKNETDPKERWDAPDRVAQRKYVRNMFRPARRQV